MRKAKNAVWCRDCVHLDEFSGACTNVFSDCCEDFPPEYGSCEYCERKKEEKKNE